MMTILISISSSPSSSISSKLRSSPSTPSTLTKKATTTTATTTTKTRISSSSFQFLYQLIVLTVYLLSCRTVEGLSLGCFQETRGFRSLGTLAGTFDPSNVTSDTCNVICTRWAFRYAGVAGGVTCFCSNTKPPGTRSTALANCNNGDTSYVLASEVPMNVINLKLTTTPLVYTTGSTITFTLTWSDAPSGVTFTVDYGEPLGPVLSVGGATPTTPLTFTGVYYKPGNYLVTVWASDGTSASFGVSIHEPVSGLLTFICPPSAANYMEIFCTATLNYGNHLLATLDYGDGQIDTFQMSDVYWHAAGPGIPGSSVTPVSNSPSGNTYFNPMSQFESDGFLVGFEYYSMVASGTVTFLLIHSSCSSGSYCYTDNTCPATACTNYQSTCTQSSTILCPLSSSCAAAASTSCSPASSRYSNGQPDTVVYANSFTATITATGHQYFKLASPVAVVAGDMVGLQTSAAGTIGTVPVLAVAGSNELPDELKATSGNTQDPLSSFTTHTDRHLFRGIAYKPANMILYHTYIKLGLMNWKLTITDMDLGTSVSATNQTLIAIGINDTTIVGPAFGITNKPVQFDILAHSGNNITYTWTMGDQSPTSTTYDPFISYTYVTKGCYDVNATSTNAISFKNSNKTQICIEDEIVNMVVGYTVSAATVPSTFQFSMTSGSDFKCDWTFGDGSTALTDEFTNPITGSIPVTHTYASDGAYVVYVYCYNNVSNATTTFTQYVQWPIINLRFERVADVAMVAFKLAALIDQGTAPDFNMTFNSQLLTFTYDPVAKRVVSQNSLTFDSGLYLATVTSSNKFNYLYIEVNYTIEYEIQNPAVTCLTAETAADLQIAYSASLTAGSGITIDWLFGDSNPHTYALQPGVKIPAGGLVDSFNHVFTWGGLFNIQITIKNKLKAYNFTCSIIVYGKIENVTLEGSYFASYLRGFGNVSFYFTATQTLVNHFVTFDFGDGTPKERYPFSTTQTYEHSYTKTGVYNVYANISNPVSFGILARTVVVAIQIANMDFIFNNPHAVINTQFDVGIILDNGEGVMLYYDFGDPVSGSANTHVMPRTPGANAYYVDWWNHIYSQVGMYIITVIAQNVIGNTTLTYTLAVQNPVPNTFVLSTDIAALPPGLITFNLTLPDTETLPTNATYIIYFGDGTASQELLLPFSSPPYFLSVKHSYSLDGVYPAQVVVRNLASNLTLNRSIGVYVPFTNFQITPMFASDLYPGSAGVGGLGPSGDIYPYMSPFLINATSTSGKADYFLIDIVDSNGNVITLNQTTSPLTIDFASLNLTPGKFSIKVTAVNGIDRVSQTINITIQNTIKTPEILAQPSPTDPSTVNVTLNFKDINPSTCLALDYGDGTRFIYALDPSACANTPYASWPFVALPSLTPPIVPPPPPHQYAKDGTYSISLKAIDISGTFEVTTLVSISKNGDCLSPVLDIKDKAVDFMQAYEHEKGNQLDVVGITNIVCDKTLSNVKMWTVWTANETDGNVLNRITSVDSYKTVKQAQLTVPGRALDYGLYKFIYNVTIEGSSIYNLVFTYIRIVPSAIVAFIVPNGMSQIARGYGNDITLSPETYSYDPDLGDSANKTFKSFQWFCRQRDEAFPLALDGSLATTPTHLVYSAQQFLATNLPNKGGCFGTGPGALSHTLGTLTFPTSLMKLNDSYVFNVIVTMGTRSSLAQLRIDLISGNPASVVIGCQDQALCTPKTIKIRINPNNRLTLFATCVEYCIPGSVFTWTASRLGLNNAWLTISNFSAYVEGINSDIIAIYNTLFYDGFLIYQNLNNYRFEVSLTPPPGSNGVIGKAYIEVVLNDEPKGGNCTISPTTGISSLTLFSIECQGWTDNDGIAVYQYHALSSDLPGQKIQIGISDTSYYRLFKLPAGAAGTNELKIVTRIIDIASAVTEFVIGVINVRSMTPAESSSLVATFLANQTTANNLLTLAANGDIRQTSGVYLSIADSLNQDSDYKATAASDPKAPPSNDPFVKTERLQDDAAYQSERDQRANLKSTMVQALNTITISDVLSVQLVASTMTQLTKVPSEINRDDQITMVKTLSYMKDTMATISDKVPLEEMKTGAQAMMNTVGNLMETIIYGQLDGTIHDITEAKKDPLYFYDTDWESPRESFDGLSKSKMKTGLQRETNTLVQKGSAQGTVSSLLESTSTVNSLLMKKIVPGEPVLAMNSKTMSVALLKDNPDRLIGKSILSGGAELVIPDLCGAGMNCSNKTPLGIEMVVTPRNIFNHFRSYEGVGNYSGTVTLNFYDDQGQKLNLQNLTKPLEITIPRVYMNPVTREEQNVSVVKFRDESTLLYYRFNISIYDGSVTMEIYPGNKSVQFLVFVRYNTYPFLNGTNKGWDYMQNLPLNITASNRPSNSTTNATKPDERESKYSIFLNEDTIQDRNGTWYVGIRQLLPQEYDVYSQSSTPAPPRLKSGEPTTNFSVLIYTSGCHHSQETDTAWTVDGCKVSPKTRTSKTVCLCNHLTSFAGGFVVQPNAIDFNFILKNADFLKNPTLYITEITIGVLYILALIWARWKDKKDLEKLGVTPLPDNDPNDKYLYEIIVSTGLRNNAGTKSKVHVIFSGDLEETDARTLEDEKRVVLKRGATDSFLMAVPRPLGALNYARIWHDNSGKGKYGSWYLNWVLVRDIQTLEKFYFIVNQWFAVEEEDGQISRLISVSGREQMIETGHAFSKRATKGLNDDHIWFSVVSRPPQSRFTRIQRLSCCLCLLFTAMFANALFYGTTNNKSANALELGPFTITPEQIYVGVISNFIVFPINFIIAFLFKNSRPRKKRASRIAEAVKKIKEQNRVVQDQTKGGPLDEGFDTPRGGDRKPILEHDYGGQAYIEPLEPRNPKTLPPGSSYPDQNVAGWDESDPNFGSETGKKKKKKKFELPWWCVIIAWILLWLTVAGCVTGVTFYGIMFQDDKCRKWITSMMIAFVTSVLLTQPIKVLLFALFFSMICKKPAEEEEDKTEEDEDYADLQRDEDWLHTHGPTKNRTIVYRPPDPEVLEKARQQRLKEVQMYSILREILFYAFFLYVIIAVSYDFRDVNSYDYKNNLLTTFVSGGAGQPNSSNSIDMVRTMTDFWSWLQKTFVPGIRVDNWYNKDPPLGLRGYLNDYVSRIMGFATLRQLRVKRRLCKVYYAMANIMKECNVPYSVFDEDKADYGPAWTPLGNDSDGSVLPEYHYKSSEELDGFPFMGMHEVYGGGGYTVELRGDRYAIASKVAEMKKNGWVDRYTRAVFMEFATYNAQVNLFGVVHIVAELLSSGGFDCYYRFDTMDLIGAQGSARIVQIVVQVIFCVFIVIFIVKEIRNIYKQRGSYFQQYWNWVEWLIIIMSICCVCMYVYRLLMTNKLTAIFAKSGGNAYMNFTGVAYWNEILLYVLGVLVFFATLKFLKLLRFNKTIGLLSSTLRYCSESIINFSIMFGLVFFAFIHFFYLVYLPSLEVFSDLVRTAEQCLMMMVGKFNFSDMAKASPILGTLMFFLYMIVVFFILMTMFIGIISDGFSAIRDDIRKQSNEHEMVEFILNRLKQWTGMSRYFGISKKVKPGKTSTGVYDPAAVEALPQRLDKFMDNISKVYFNHDSFESLFKDGTSGAPGKQAMGKGHLVSDGYGGGSTEPPKFDPNPKARMGYPG